VDFTLESLMKSGDLLGGTMGVEKKFMPMVHAVLGLKINVKISIDISISLPKPILSVMLCYHIYNIFLISNYSWAACHYYSRVIFPIARDKRIIKGP